MKIDDKLLECGIDETIVEYFFKKTKLANRTIIWASLCHSNPNDLVIKLNLEGTPASRKNRIISLNLNITKIREAKLNLIL